jgi:tetratricopeptide (TPR) repeat protein
LAVGFGGKRDVSFIELWDIDRRQRLAVMAAATTIPGYTTDENTGLVTALVFSPDGKHLVSGFGSLSLLGSGDRGDHPLLVYDVAARRVIRRLRGQRNDCVAVCFSQDGSRLASACYDGTARIWDAATWQELHILENPDTASDRGNRRVCDVAFSPDGRLLAMASAEGNVVIWDAATGEQRQTLSGHANMVMSVAFSPDGRTLASGSEDSTIRLWNTATWRELVRLDPEAAFDPTSLAFSPDGSRLLAASFRGEAMMWSVLRAGDESGTTAEQLAAWLESGDVGWDKRVERAPAHHADNGGPALASSLVPPYHFASRVRMLSENLRLHEALEKLSHERADNEAVQAALAAARANWHALRQEWEPAVEQFDLLAHLAAPTRSASEEKGAGEDDNSDSSLALRVSVDNPNPLEAWLRTPGLLRIATALFHEGRPAEAALLLTGGEKRRADDGNGTRASSFGFRYAATEYPYKLLRFFRGSPAWRAGLRAGDQLLKFNDLEVAAENVAKLVELTQRQAAVRFTVQRAAQKQPETMELTKGSHIQDDVTNLLIEELLVAVNEKLAESPDDERPGRPPHVGRPSRPSLEPALLWLRAELAGQSSGFERQVADYTAAIQALSKLPQDDAAKNLASLYRLRGDAHLKWQKFPQALEDYAHVVTENTTDEDLLANQALALASVFFERESPVTWTVLKPIEAKSELGATLSILSDDSILASGDNPQNDRYRVMVSVAADTDLAAVRLEALTHPSLPGNGPGRYTGRDGGQFAGNFSQQSWNVTAVSPDQKNLVKLNFDKAWDDRIVVQFPIRLSGEWNVAGGGEGRNGTAIWSLSKPVSLAAGSTLTFEMQFAGLGQENLGHFRLSFSSDPTAFDLEPKRVAAKRLTDPWQKLAAAYLVQNNQAAIDQLVERHPESAGLIGDLFTQGEKADWRRAIEIYSKGITWGGLPRPSDPNDGLGRPPHGDLLAKRARAYEELRDWHAAATDWQRAAGENPDGAKMLADFANRLVQVDEWQLALTARERAQEILEAALEADPGDEPVADILASLLLDLSDADQLKWTALKPAELKTDGGATLTTNDDGSVAVERAPDRVVRADAITLSKIPESANAVRVETAPDSEPGGKKSPMFSEYRSQALGAAVSQTGAFRGRYVRIDLPGDNKQFPRQESDGVRKILSLAEVQIFEGSDNVARFGRASQSTTNYGGEPQRALDGNTNGDWGASSLSHTDERDPSPWWEVDLKSQRAIDRIVVWNRTDNVGKRLSHFRVRILNASRQVVFERVIDAAPDPATEIVCRSFLVEKPSAAGNGQPQWALRLGQEAGIATGQRFRVSTADELCSLERKEAIGEARKITATAARLAVAYDVNSDSVASADWFARALDQAKYDYERSGILKELENHPAVLAKLLERRPDDADLQLALARRHVDQGHKKLSDEQLGEALAEFQQASDIFTRLLAANAGPEWTVLDPTQLTSEGGATLTVQDDGTIIASGVNPDHDTYRLTVEFPPMPIGAVRLELIPLPASQGGKIGRARDGNFVLSRFALKARSKTDDARLTPLTITDTAATFEEPGWGIANAVDASPSTAWAVWPKLRELQAAHFKIAPNASAAGPLEIVIEMHNPRPDARGCNLALFRLSAAAERDAFDRARLRLSLHDSELAALDIAIGKAHAREDRTEEAVAAFARALERIESDEERKKLIEEIKDEKAALATVAGQRLQDVPLQLALARTLAESGKKALDDGRQDEALTDLEQAQAVYTRLLAERPEPAWTVLNPVEMKSHGGATLTRLADGSVLASGTNPDRDVYTLTARTDLRRITGIRLEALTDPSLPQGGPGRFGNGNFHLNELLVSKAGEPVALTQVVVDYDEQQQQGRNAIDGRLDPSYWGTWPRDGQTNTAYIATWLEVTPADELKFEMHFSLAEWARQHNLGRFRLSVIGDDGVLEAARFQQELKDSGLVDLALSLAGALGRQGRLDESAAAFGRALDLADNREARAKIVKEASEYEGLLDKLAERRPDDTTFYDVLARYYHRRGDPAKTRAAADKAEALLEQSLKDEPTQAAATLLADLLLDVRQDETALVPTSENDPVRWRFTTNPPPPQWNQANFNDSSWREGEAPFGKQSSSVRAAWRTPDIWLRHNFDVPASDDARTLFVRLKVDDTAEVFLNGKRLINRGWTEYKYVLEVLDTASPRSVPGKNSLAVHCRDTGGSEAFFDLGLFSANDDWKELTAAKTIADPWVRLAAAYHAFSADDKARDALSRAIDRATGDADRAAVARQASALGDLFAELLERFPDDKVLRLGQAKYLASQRLKENQFQAAVDALSGALADFPDDIELLNMRAEAQMKLWHWSAAIDDFSHVIARQTDEVQRRAAAVARAEAQLRLGQSAEAADLFTEEMFRSSSWQGPHDVVAAQLLAGNVPAAKAAATRLFQVIPNDSKDAYWSNNLVTDFITIPGMITPANQARLTSAAQAAGGGWTAPFTAAIHYRLGNLKEAAPLLSDRSIEPALLCLAAMLLDEQGERSRARGYLDQADEWFRKQRDRDPDAMIPGGQAWQDWSSRLALWREAARKLAGPQLAELDASIKDEPDRAALLIERAGLLVDADLYDEALNDLDRLIALKVDSPEVHALRGRALAGLRYPDDALGLLNETVEAGSKDGHVYAARGNILRDRGQTDAARADLERSLELHPTDRAAMSLADLLLAGLEKSEAWTVLKPVDMKSAGGATLTLEPDGSILASGKNPDRDVYIITARCNLKAITAVRLEALPDRNLPSRGPGRSPYNGNFHLNELRVFSGDDPVTLTKIVVAYDESQQSGNVIDGKVDSTMGWGNYPRSGEKNTAVISTRHEHATSENLRIEMYFSRAHWTQHNLGRFRLSLTDDTGAASAEESRLTALKLADPWRKLAAAYHLRGDQPSLDRLLKHHPDAAAAFIDAAPGRTPVNGGGPAVKERKPTR